MVGLQAGHFYSQAHIKVESPRSVSAPGTAPMSIEGCMKFKSVLAHFLFSAKSSLAELIAV